RALREDRPAVQHQRAIARRRSSDIPSVGHLLAQWRKSAYKSPMPKPLAADCLAGLPGVAHGFFTRHGGVSVGGYATLNCGAGSQDDPDAVRENRARVAAF